MTQITAYRHIKRLIAEKKLRLKVIFKEAILNKKE